MTTETLPDLTVRAHDLHDAAFKVSASNMAFQAAQGSPAQARAYLDQMEQQLIEVGGQVRRMRLAIRKHRRGG